MREVIDGCKYCGERMLTDGNPLVVRSCKAKHRREHNRKTAERRKAERHAAKEEMGVPRCEQCGKAIEGAMRLTASYQWARKFCGNTCRKAAFRARNG
jgi:hypothetical protein